MVRGPGVGVGRAPRRRSTRPDARDRLEVPRLLSLLFGLGALPGDSLDDLYPGSGIVTWAWQRWTGALAEEELVPALTPATTAGAGVQEAS
jgi:hypothetical protein